MVSYGFKGGIGTASRNVDAEHGKYMVGALVQANYGIRRTLRIVGVPVGEEITDLQSGVPAPPEEHGSIIVVIATDAPLLPHQLRRVAQRASLALGRMGGYASNGSGDIFIAFSTANPGAAARTGAPTLTMLPNDQLGSIFLAQLKRPRRPS
jgi:L-aminopeptidase/D-esterase-like protein